MPAYIIAHGEITDREVFREYGRRSHPLLEKFGGKVVASGKHEVLEGDWHPKVLVVTQWPDMAAARAYYNSPEYSALIALRRKAATVGMVLVEDRGGS